MRLLLVEDDEMLGASLKKGLGFNGYSAEWFKTGSDALAAMQSGTFDLGIFDVNLPDISGVDVLRRLRATSAGKKMPVLMLTVNDALRSKISGLDAGADDYMTKPFDLEELLARLRALIRRKDGQSDNILRGRDLALNLETRSVEILSTGQIYTPTAKEFMVLNLLLQRPGGMVSKERIEEALYGWNDEVGSNTVEVLIYNLRKKLRKDIIITLRGVGYMVMA